MKHLITFILFLSSSCIALADDNLNCSSPANDRQMIECQYEALNDINLIVNYHEEELRKVLDQKQNEKLDNLLKASDAYTAEVCELKNSIFESRKAPSTADEFECLSREADRLINVLKYLTRQKTTD